MRPIPTFKDEYKIPDEAPAREGYITQSREYELITPLFGGGVEPGIADSVTTIRATEIRGHLRFWWRATRGNAPEFEGKIEFMKKTEDKIWGASSSDDAFFPSSVQVQVNTTQSGQTFKDRDSRGKEIGVYEPVSRLGYVAFSLRDRKLGVVERIRFTLNIHYPSVIGTDIEAALWAWETFGGLGGRTRRGFGALKLLRVNGKGGKLWSSSPQIVIQEILNKLGTFCKKGSHPPSVPFLTLEAEDYLIMESKSSSVEIMADLIDGLKQFRQDRPMNQFIDPRDGRKKKRPGRNRWPEPDEIRRLTKKRCSRHREELSRFNVFPRAQFGLPIIFQFKDSDQGDPGSTTLQGAKKDSSRFASPLITKPLPCDDGKYLGLAFILGGTSVSDIPGGVILKDAPGAPQVITELTKEQARQIKHLNGNQDVLISFLNFMEEE